MPTSEKDLDKKVTSLDKLREELAALRAQREDAERSGTVDFRAAELDRESAMLRAEIERERSLLKSVQERNESNLAGAKVAMEQAEGAIQAEKDRVVAQKEQADLAAQAEKDRLAAEKEAAAAAEKAAAAAEKGN
jgi:colicin import membrane protein